MPSKTPEQQRYFNYIRAIQNGKVSKKKASKEALKTAKSMTKKQVADFADHVVKEKHILSFDEFTNI